MYRNRHVRRTYGGKLVPRYPLHPGLLRRGRAPSSGGSLANIGVKAMLVLAVLALVVVVVGVAGAYGAYAQVAASLAPRLAALQDREVFETSRIYDRNGILLYEFFDAGRRTQVNVGDVSPVLINATIAIEDKTFYTNPGIDLEGIARALYQNLTSGEEVSGASTITQQVIKNIILTEEERSYENRYQRKITEIILAQELNQRYSKDEILELYLNEIYYGNLAYGIEAASDVYFDTSSSDLSLPQAALLAGLPQLPSRYDPMIYAANDEQGAYLPGVRLTSGWLSPDYDLPARTSPPKWRQVAVLRQMVDEGYATELEARRAAAVDLRLAPQEVPLNAPHFVFYVRRLLEERYGQQLVTGGGLNIYTTLDLNVQRMAQQQAAEHITSLDSRNIHNAAVVVMQPNTGQILAMVGSIDYNAIEETRTPGQEGNVLDGQVNVAIRERQPGSALKPFTYLAAMEQGMTPASVLWDVPTEFPTGSGEWYAPENYNGRWNGPVRMRAALANSLNMPAVKALKVAGIGNTLDLLDRVGIREGLERGEGYYGLSLTLGGGEVTLLELTTAYNTLASGGRYYPPAPILSITDSDGNMIESYQQTPGEQVVDPALVAIITDMMSDDRARQPIWGLNSALNLSQPAAVKTGTSNDWRDAWTAGFTPYVTVGVWSGNNNNEPTERVESLQGGGIIWGNVMEELFTWIDTQPSYNELFSAPFPDSTLQRAFTLPPGDAVVRNPVCSIPGAFGGDDEELFTQAMLQNAEASSSGRLGCDMYVRIPVVRTPSGSYCRPLRGENYPSSWMETVTVWDIPESDGSERVQYRWSGGSAGRSAGAYPVCTPAMLVPPTPVPTPTPDRPAPPVAGAVQMPSLIGYGENQAKSILAGLGVTSVVVDYQTRDRVPQLFDSYGPYVVLSTSPTAGNWIMPGTTVVLGIRSPDESAPADAGSNGRGTRNQAPQPTNPPASRDSSSGLWPPLATPTSVGLPPPAGTSQAIPGARP